MRLFIILYLSLFLISPDAIAQSERDENGYRAPATYEEAVLGFFITKNATHPMGMSNRTKYAEQAYNFGNAEFGKGSVKTAELAMAWLKAFNAYPAGSKSPRVAFKKNINTLETAYRETPQKLIEPYTFYGDTLLKIHHVRSPGEATKYIKKALAIIKDTKGKNSIVEALFHQKVSVSYYANMNTKLAKKHHKYAISIYSKQGDSFNQSPIPLIKIAPKHPRDNETGWAMVEFTVTKKGQVKNAKAIDHEGSKLFKGAAIVAAKKFLYIPEIKNGKAVNTDGVKNKITFQ